MTDGHDGEPDLQYTLRKVPRREMIRWVRDNSDATPSTSYEAVEAAVQIGGPGLRSLYERYRFTGTGASVTWLRNVPMPTIDVVRANVQLVDPSGRTRPPNRHSLVWVFREEGEMRLRVAFPAGQGLIISGLDLMTVPRFDVATLLWRRLADRRGNEQSVLELHASAKEIDRLVAELLPRLGCVPSVPIEALDVRDSKCVDTLRRRLDGRLTTASAQIDDADSSVHSVLLTARPGLDLADSDRFHDLSPYPQLRRAIELTTPSGPLTIAISHKAFSIVFSNMSLENTAFIFREAADAGHWTDFVE